MIKPIRGEAIALLSGAALAVLGSLSATGAAQAQESKPNILFILADSLGGVNGSGPLC